MTDWRVYYVTDPDLTGGRDRVAATVYQAVLGGAGVIQLRDKHADEQTFGQQIVACQRAIDEAVAAGAAQPALFINDRVQLAIEFGTHLHIGQSDGDPVAIRKALPAEAMLGISVSSLAELAVVVRDGVADVIGLSPVWATSTKTDTQQPLGLDGLRAIVAAKPAALPAVAIGGINQSNVKQVIATGVDGICVVSAIAAAADPRSATTALVTAWEQS